MFVDTKRVLKDFNHNTRPGYGQATAAPSFDNLCGMSCSTPRLRGACRMYVLQNSGVAASAAAALVLFYLQLQPGTLYWVLVRARSLL